MDNAGIWFRNSDYTGPGPPRESSGPGTATFLGPMGLLEYYKKQALFNCFGAQVICTRFPPLSLALHRPTMVSFFEVFYVFFINFRMLNSKILPRFIHHVLFF
jgi:hypothetical protein